MSNKITQEEKLELDKENRRIFKEIKICNQVTLRYLKEAESSIREIEKIIDEISAERLDKALPLPQDKTSNETSVSKTASEPNY